MDKYYSLRDKKVEVFNQPFMSMNDQAVVAIVSREIKDGNGTLSKHPEDFELYKVFEFDQFTGKVTPCLTKLADFAEVTHGN